MRNVWGDFILKMYLVVALLFINITLSAIAQDVHSIQQQTESRRFIDCYQSPAGDEIICKQVTATEPYQRP